jgi:hypothetical protein
LLLTFAATSSPAYEGVVKAYTGRVLYRAAKAEGFLPIKKNQKLSPNDQIRTDKNGRVQFTFKSGATVLVKENAHVTVKSDRVGDKVAFLRGEFLIGLRQKLKQGRTFEVHTPACVAAVRGTVFWGLSDDKKKSTYACFTGAIEVTARGRSVTLNPGQKLAVAFGAAPSKTVPANIPKEYIKTFAVDDSLQGVDEILEDGGAK